MPNLLWCLAVPCVIAPFHEIISLLSLTLTLHLLVNLSPLQDSRTHCSLEAFRDASSAETNHSYCMSSASWELRKWETGSRLLLCSFCSFVFCFHQHLLSKMMEIFKISSSSPFQRIRDDLENQMSHCKLRSLIGKYILLWMAFSGWVESLRLGIHTWNCICVLSFLSGTTVWNGKAGSEEPSSYDWPDRMTRRGH